jgi:hypothetical protein
VLGFVEANVATKRYEYAVRVKDLGHELLTLARREVDATVWRSGYRAKRFDSVSS